MKVTVLGCGALGQLWLTALYKTDMRFRAGYASRNHFVTLISLRLTVVISTNQ